MLNNIIKKLLFKNKYGWFGDYHTWGDAVIDTIGYDSDEIFQKVSKASLKVKTGEAVYERDSVIFDKIQYSWPLLSSLMYVSAKNSGRLNIIDFGGSLGSTYFQNQKFLMSLPMHSWNIIEQPKFVDYGKKYIQTENLHFFNSIDECLESFQVNAILLSSVLPYLEKPHEFLYKVINKYSFEYIIIDRTGFIKRNKDRITVQRVSPEIYNASYPCWFFNKEKMLRNFQVKYEKLIEWDALGSANIESNFKGMLFKRLSVT